MLPLRLAFLQPLVAREVHKRERGARLLRPPLPHRGRCEVQLKDGMRAGRVLVEARGRYGAPVERVSQTARQRLHAVHSHVHNGVKLRGAPLLVILQIAEGSRPTFEKLFCCSDYVCYVAR